MKHLSLALLGASMVALSTAPALAEKRDRLFTEQYRDKIAAARAEPGISQYGGADLDKATASLNALHETLDDNDTAQAKAVMAQIDALIETARVRAKIASTTTELQQAKADGKQRNEAELAAAQAQAQVATAQADAAKAEAARARAALQDYQLKQTALGATLVLQDVVFETGKADLKPGAAERLRPLAQYLAANPDVKVRIDGHTDAQGTDAYNQQLSTARANAIRAALATMSVDPARVQAIGHGEGVPVADNRTEAGRLQNRRVEITIVGQQASSFAAVR